MKLSVSLILLAVNIAFAFPGNGRGRMCNPNDNECQCRKLMGPKTPPIRGAMRTVKNACFEEFGYPIPGRGMGGPSMFEQYPDEVKNCLLEHILTMNGIMDNSGSINAGTATDIINYNKGRTNLSVAKVDATINAVPTCVAEAELKNLKALAFQVCMTDTCLTA